MKAFDNVGLKYCDGKWHFSTLLTLKMGKKFHFDRFSFFTTAGTCARVWRLGLSIPSDIKLKNNIFHTFHHVVHSMLVHNFVIHVDGYGNESLPLMCVPHKAVCFAVGSKYVSSLLNFNINISRWNFCQMSCCRHNRLNIIDHEWKVPLGRCSFLLFVLSTIKNKVVDLN